VDVTISPLRGSEGEALGAVGIIRDMTEQKVLLDRLRQERDLARRYLDVARVTILTLDEKGAVTMVNRRGLQILGYESEEILGRDWFDTCVPAERREKARRALFRMMDGVIEEVSDQEAIVLTRGGNERRFSWHVVRLADDEGRGTGVLCSGEDITDRMRAQEELYRTEKLAAIGQLAAGVAHEVNNPLAGILVYVKLLQKKHAAGKIQADDTERQLVKIEKELERSSRIIKNLLDFSRQSVPTLRPVAINEVIEATLSIVGHQISLGKVEVVRECATELPPIVADFDQIQQAMMNVILNAAQAMPEGGTLTIKTSLERGVELPAGHRDAVRIDIRDTGVGIPEENLEKVFTPFFSTKEKGKGVGLGLPAVQGIIERHKGRIAVESEVGVGTTVTAWLEASDG
jgi:PAS domain S-box-containing protein